jgi:hypothetical protein
MSKHQDILCLLYSSTHIYLALTNYKVIMCLATSHAVCSYLMVSDTKYL